MDKTPQIESQRSPDRAPGGTHELKFFVSPAQIGLVSRWADAHHLTPDPHSDPQLGDGYYVNNLYLDTAGFDIYRRSAGYRSAKYRLRRYGTASTIWLEQKAKHQGCVTKRRTTLDEVAARGVFLAAAPDDPGEWFRSLIQDKALQSVCQVSYRRFAWLSSEGGSPVRLTIDCELHAAPMHDWMVPVGPPAGTRLSDAPLILEMKFRDELPTLFRGLIQDLQLAPKAFSKFRASVAACLMPAQVAAHAA